jgi:hypothetical protein
MQYSADRHTGKQRESQVTEPKSLLSQLLEKYLSSRVHDLVGSLGDKLHSPTPSNPPTYLRTQYTMASNQERDLSVPAPDSVDDGASDAHDEDEQVYCYCNKPEHGVYVLLACPAVPSLNATIA